MTWFKKEVLPKELIDTLTNLANRKLLGIVDPEYGSGLQDGATELAQYLLEMYGKESE